MNSLEKRSKELSRAVAALSKDVSYKKQVSKPKSLDFLNNLTGLNIPKLKPKKIPVESKPEVQIVEKKVFYGKPGEKGDRGEKGDKGEKGDAGNEGRDGRDGRDGINPTIESAATIAERLNALEGVLDAKVIKNLPEFNIKDLKRGGKSQLSLEDIKGARLDRANGGYNMNDQRWHGGGGGTTGTPGLNVQVDGAIEGLLQTLNFVAGNNMTITYSVVGGVPTITFNSTGSPVTSALAVADLSPQADGSNKIFTIPTNTSVISLISSDAPFIYRQGTDYTVSGTTLTLIGTVSPPSAGATVLVEYTPSGVSVAAYDLSPFTDGVTTVFTVPASFSVLSLRGSDFPFIYEPTTDFTVVGTTLTLTGIAPSLKSTLMFDYTLTSPSATTVDLTSQCNGTNLNFTIPNISSAISLTGTDFPIVYRQGVDYVISGTTLTLVRVNAPTSTLLLTYV